MDAVAQSAASALADVLLVLGCDVEREGNTDFGFVEVGNVQDEGQFVTGVDEAESGAASEGGDNSVSDAVHALRRSGDRLVDGITAAEVAGCVLSSPPTDSGTRGLGSIAVFDTVPFAAEELVAGQACGVFVGEAEAVHGAGHSEAAAHVGPLSGLGFDERG